LDTTLATDPYLAGKVPTIADLALYSYTARAPEGRIDLEPYANVTAWLRRVEALPGFTPMLASQ
jgi:glutathione S-transferase